MPLPEQNYLGTSKFELIMQHQGSAMEKKDFQKSPDDKVSGECV